MLADTSIRICDAYLTYYMHIEKPYLLSDEEWAEQLQNLHFIRQQEAKKTT